jgi:methylmalonyl-CoA mutase cobalamin-binding subunit
MAVRCPHRAIVALAAGASASDGCVGALLESLDQLGVQTVYLGMEESAQRIVAAVVKERADAVELCLGGSGGVLVLRGLLRELIQIGRRDVSIVVHRVQ